MKLSSVNKSDCHEMPSGSVIDLLNFNAAALKTIDDCDEAELVIAEKLIEIEFQLACYAAGFHADGRKVTPDDPFPPLWEQRAAKAMALTKLQKAEVNQRRQKINKSFKDAILRNRDRLFVDVAREMLASSPFHAIITEAAARADK